VRVEWRIIHVLLVIARNVSDEAIQFLLWIASLRSQ